MSSVDAIFSVEEETTISIKYYSASTANFNNGCLNLVKIK